MAKQIADGIWLTGGSKMKLIDGVWQTGESSYLVANEGKLSEITGAEPGTQAHTAGYKKLWELDTDGTTWVSMV